MFYNQFRMVIVQQFWIFSQMSDWESTERETDDETRVKQDLKKKEKKVTCQSAAVSWLKWNLAVIRVTLGFLRDVMQFEHLGVIERRFQGRFLCYTEITETTSR